MDRGSVLVTVASATDAEPDLVPPPIFSQRRRLATRAVGERRAIVAATPPGEHRDPARGSALAVPLRRASSPSGARSASG